MHPTKQNDIVANNNNYKVSKNKHTTDEDKNKQIHSQIKILNEHLNNINKIETYKKLNITQHKIDINITKYKILNMTEHKTDMNITKRLTSTPMTEHKTIQLHFGEPNNNHIQVKQTSKLPTKKVYENIQSTTNKYTLFIPVTEKSGGRKTMQ